MKSAIPANYSRQGNNVIKLRDAVRQCPVFVFYFFRLWYNGVEYLI